MLHAPSTVNARPYASALVAARPRQNAFGKLYVEGVASDASQPAVYARAMTLLSTAAQQLVRARVGNELDSLLAARYSAEIANMRPAVQRVEMHDTPRRWIHVGASGVVRVSKTELSAKLHGDGNSPIAVYYWQTVAMERTPVRVADYEYRGPMRFVRITFCGFITRTRVAALGTECIEEYMGDRTQVGIPIVHMSYDVYEALGHAYALGVEDSIAVDKFEPAKYADPASPDTRSCTSGSDGGGEVHSLASSMGEDSCGFEHEHEHHSGSVLACGHHTTEQDGVRRPGGLDVVQPPAPPAPPAPPSTVPTPIPNPSTGRPHTRSQIHVLLLPRTPDELRRDSMTADAHEEWNTRVDMRPLLKQLERWMVTVAVVARNGRTTNTRQLQKLVAMQHREPFLDALAQSLMCSAMCADDHLATVYMNAVGDLVECRLVGMIDVRQREAVLAQYRPYRDAAIAAAKMMHLRSSETECSSQSSTTWYTGVRRWVAMYMQTLLRQYRRVLLADGRDVFMREIQSDVHGMFGLVVANVVEYMQRVCVPVSRAAKRRMSTHPTPTTTSPASGAVCANDGVKRARAQHRGHVSKKKKTRR